MLAPPEKSPPRVLAEVRDYDGLHAALRARADQLEVSRLCIDDLTGLQSGYTAKLLAPVPIKRIGLQSLGPLLTVLGLRLLVAEDAETMRQFAPRLEKRQRASVRVASGKRRKKRPKLGPEWARLMNARRSLLLSPTKRKRIAKHAALVRWADIRATVRAAAKPPKPNGGTRG